MRFLDSLSLSDVLAPLSGLSPWQYACLLYVAYRVYCVLFPGPPPPPYTGKLRQPKGSQEFAAALASAPAQQLVVVDYFATWCGPCVAIAPFLEQLAEAHPSVLFLKIQEDESRDVLVSQRISRFPTFRFYIAGRCVREVLGADRATLQASVEALQASAAKGEVLAEFSLGAAAGSGGCAIA